MSSTIKSLLFTTATISLLPVSANAAYVVFSEHLGGDIGNNVLMNAGIDGVSGTVTGNSSSLVNGVWDADSVVLQGLTPGQHTFEYSFTALSILDGNIGSPDWVGLFVADSAYATDYGIPYAYFDSIGSAFAGTFVANVDSTGMIEFVLGPEGDGAIAYSIGLYTPGVTPSHVPLPSAFWLLLSGMTVLGASGVRKKANLRTKR